MGVNKSASAAEIKKSYYGLAKKFHPDTNKEPTAKEKFADAQSAYELLNDPQKKAAWDQFGAAAFDQGFEPGAGQGAGGSPFGGGFGGGGFGGAGFGGGAQGGFGADFNFEDLFNAFGGGGGGRRGRQQRGNPFVQEEVLVGDNIEVQANISFMDAAKGTSKDIFITPLTQCKTCSGNGLKKGYKKDTCKVCAGTGTQIHMAQAGFQMASTCSACGGQGIKIPRGGECNTCSGNGVTREKRTVNVDIPGGVEDGMRLRVKAEGDSPATGQAANSDSRSQKGDLYVFIRVAADPKFSRSGSDVLYTASLPITTAILGGEIKVPTLDGKVKVRVATGTGTGDRITLTGMGMSKLSGQRRLAKGDLRVEFKVQMPKYLSTNQRAIVEMLANDLGDKSAKRVMDFGTSAKDAPATAGKKSSSSSDADQHENESFLKRAWHNITGQHDHLGNAIPPENQNKSGADVKPTDTTKDEEPKKASGGGSG